MTPHVTGGATCQLWIYEYREKIPQNREELVAVEESAYLVMRIELYPLLLAIVLLQDSGNIPWAEGGKAGLQVQTAQPNDLPYIQGQTIILTCLGAPVASSWFKDGSPLDYKEIGRVKASSNVLIILRARPRDSGEYFCQTSDRNRSRSHEITVLEKPNVEPARLRFSTAVGGTAVLSARLVGSHPQKDRLSVRWIHNGRHVTGATERVKISNSNTELLLELKNVTVEDEGDYIVRVGNDAGHDKAHFKLFVSAPPTRPQNVSCQIENDSLHQEESGAHGCFVISWKPSMSPSHFPITEYRVIFRDRESLNVLLHITLNSFSRKVSLCSFTFQSPADQVLATVISTNSHGRSPPSSPLFLSSNGCGISVNTQDDFAHHIPNFENTILDKQNCSSTTVTTSSTHSAATVLVASSACFVSSGLTAIVTLGLVLMAGYVIVETEERILLRDKVEEFSSLSQLHPTASTSDDITGNEHFQTSVRNEKRRISTVHCSGV